MNLEEHLLTILAEECGEVAHHTHKALRFGLDDKDITKDPKLCPTERENIQRELNHVFAMAEILSERGTLMPLLDRKVINEKKAAVWEMMAYSRQKGTWNETE